MTLPRVEVFTDGACAGNPGAGGWAALLRYGDKERVIRGGEAQTTNNRMELMGAIKALEALTKPAQVNLYTDSQYVQKGITEWLSRWKANGWRTSGREPVRNRDLWERLELAVTPHRVNWQWVRGHSGHPENERVDREARAAIDDLNSIAENH